MDKKIIYYEDELNDEFSKVKIIPRNIDENYKYINKNYIFNEIVFIKYIIQMNLFKKRTKIKFLY